MAVTGAVLGDISGSQFEFNKPHNVDYRHCGLFTENCTFTDDTVMTLAVKKAITEGLDLTRTMQNLGRYYPDSGYGGKFYKWVFSRYPKPYNSFGNGSAMRVSFVGEYYEDLKDVMAAAKKTAAVSHNHPEGIKGAVVTAVCIWMAKHGKSKQDIYDYVLEQYPAAMRCFYESDSFETFMRNIFRFDCDSDTLGAIGGAVAEEFYHGVGFDADQILKKYLDQRLYRILKA